MAEAVTCLYRCRRARNDPATSCILPAKASTARLLVVPQERKDELPQLWLQVWQHLEHLARTVRRRHRVPDRDGARCADGPGVVAAGCKRGRREPPQPQLHAGPGRGVGRCSERPGDRGKGAVFGVKSVQGGDDGIGRPDLGDCRELVVDVVKSRDDGERVRGCTVFTGSFSGGGSVDAVDGLDDQAC